MTTIQQETKKVPEDAKKIVNDFSFTIATMNGSGSQTSNLTLLKDWWTIRIALLTTVPTRIINPSMVSTSKPWGAINKFTSLKPRNPPAAARGTVKRMIKG